ncbi:hypothetical protein, partial [Streptomyces roseolus]|uniref:hypothetical protein n=1 Tax=Streptomyces roseolus TaxID=67358 RepID=UPI00366137C4
DAKAAVEEGIVAGGGVALLAARPPPRVPRRARASRFSRRARPFALLAACPRPHPCFRVFAAAPALSCFFTPSGKRSE